MSGELLLARYVDEDVAALKSLALDARHKRALEWIIRDACLTYDEPFVPGQPDLTLQRMGRRSAGLQIVKLINMPARETPDVPPALSRRGRKGALK